MNLHLRDSQCKCLPCLTCSVAILLCGLYLGAGEKARGKGNFITSLSLQFVAAVDLSVIGHLFQLASPLSSCNVQYCI